MQTMRSDIVIIYNDIDVTDSIGNEISSFSWTDNATGNADTLSIELSNLDNKWFGGYYPESGDNLKAWIQLKEWAADFREGKIYCGTFNIDSLVFSGFPERLRLSGISTPINSDINIRQKNRSWNDTTLKTVMSDIASEAGIPLVFDASDVAIQSINQTGKTDLAFVYALCSDYGLCLKMYDNEMVIYDLTSYEAKAARYDITRDMIKGLGVYNITNQSTKVYDSVKIQYTSEAGETLTYEYTMPMSAGKQMFISTKAESLSDAEKKAKAALRENRRDSRRIEITLIGSAKYMATDVFNLSGFGKLDGKYFIDNVTHNKSSGKYIVSLSAHIVADL